MREILRVVVCVLTMLLIVGSVHAAQKPTDCDDLMANLKALGVTDAEIGQLRALALTDSEFQKLAWEFCGLRQTGLTSQQTFMMQARLQAARVREEVKQASRQFMGFNWGLGFGMSADLSSGDRVDEAAVVDGLVRVSKQSNILPRIILEGHHFIFNNGKKDNKDKRDIATATRGCGPFIAVQSNGDDTISGFGFGWMWGFRRELNKPSSFNIALGPIVDANVKTLGDGITANQSLPGAETAVRFKEESRLGLLIFASFSF